jgi:hypothetical protein
LPATNEAITVAAHAAARPTERPTLGIDAAYMNC